VLHGRRSRRSFSSSVGRRRFRFLPVRLTRCERAPRPRVCPSSIAGDAAVL